MDNTYTPLVTDEHIERASGDPIAAQAVSAYEFGKCIGMARGMASARSTYEAERVQTHAELAELRAENERMREAGSLCAAMLKGLGDGHYTGSFHFGADIRVDAKERFEAWDAATLKPSQPSTKDTE